MNSSTFLRSLPPSVKLLLCLAASAALPLSAASEPPPRNPVQTSARSEDWPVDAVWYQIFPERFRNGDPSNDPTRESLERPLVPSAQWQESSWTGDWYARASWERELGPDFYSDGILDRRYGGDLQGVLDKLDYLADLGVNALYFNPLFYARSLHKYDGCSFHHVDPFFGPDPRGDLALIAKEDGSDPKTWGWTTADKLFLRLLREAHRRGMHVVLDGVFNHSGRDCFAFKNLRKNQERSPFRNWYVVESFDDPKTKRDEFDFVGWWGYKSLPVFASTPDHDDMAAGPKAYIFAATRRWMDPNGDGDPSDGIDGWRLDAAPERPAKFWADWNAWVRTLNPKAYTSCEVWDDASKLISAGGFSASMNYHAFAIPVKGFLVDAGISATEFARLLDERRAALPKGSASVMQNLMDSHDTDRLASMIVNGGHVASSDPAKIVYNANANAHLSGSYEIRKPNERERDIQRLVLLFQMTYLGAPMIYYGDEAGMWGGTDPDDRKPMLWSDLKYASESVDPRGSPRPPDAVEFDQRLFNAYRSAIGLRRAIEPLRRGEFRVLGTFDAARSLAFLRSGATGSVVVALNRSDEPQSIRFELPEAEASAFANGKVVFVSRGETESVRVQTSGAAISVELPRLTGAVVAP